MAVHPDLIGSYWTLAGETVPPPGDGPEWSPFDFADRVELAGTVGFEGIGIWHEDVRSVLEDYTLEEMRDLIDAAGLSHVELEFIEYGQLYEDGELDGAAPDRLELLLEAADSLDANHVKIGNIAGIQMPKDAIAASIHDVAERAAAADTNLGLELITADVNIDSIEDGLSLVAGVPNAGIILDTWHVVKMGIPFEAIRSIPAEDIMGVEINDGQISSDMDLQTETTGYRKLPGEGEFDVSEFIRSVQATGYSGPWGVEVLSHELRSLSMEELYPRVYDRTVEAFEFALSN